MKNGSEVIETTIKKYSSDLPWGIYFYHVSNMDMKLYGGVPAPQRYRESEKYLWDMIKDICLMAIDKRSNYTETSPAGLVYIAVPLYIDNKIWAVLAAYLSLGREGSWRRSLNRGPSVSQTVHFLEELGFIISTHQEVQKWYNPSFQSLPDSEQETHPNKCEGQPIPNTAEYIRW